MGFVEDTCPRGKPMTIQLLEKSSSIIEHKYDSQTNPIQVFFPSSAAVGSPIGDCSVGVWAGFTRSLAAKMILEATSVLDLPDEEFQELIPLLKSVLYVKVTYPNRGSTISEQESGSRCCAVCWLLFVEKEGKNTILNLSLQWLSTWCPRPCTMSASDIFLLYFFI